MPKATLEFQLPEEQEEFKLAQRGIDYSIVLRELDEWLRARIKYDNPPQATLEAYEYTRKHLRELAADRGLEI